MCWRPDTVREERLSAPVRGTIRSVQEEKGKSTGEWGKRGHEGRGKEKTGLALAGKNVLEIEEALPGEKEALPAI